MKKHYDDFSIEKEWTHVMIKATLCQGIDVTMYAWLFSQDKISTGLELQFDSRDSTLYCQSVKKGVDHNKVITIDAKDLFDLNNARTKDRLLSF